MMHVKVDYPSAKTEREILRLTRDEALGTNSGQSTSRSLLNRDAILAMRKEVLRLHMSETVENYIVELVMATRQAKRYDDELAANIAFGASPRATITLDRTSRAQAFLQGRDYVTPGDVQEVASDVLRHRVGLSFEAEAKGVTADSIVAQIIRLVAAP
jgi:MoxR-like ATPase